MAPLGINTDKLAESGVDAVKQNAGNPMWVLGFILIALLTTCVIVVVGGGFYAVNTFAKPMLDANLESVKASTEAIKSNAETNRRMESSLAEIRTIEEERKINAKDAQAQLNKTIEDIKTMDAKKMDTLEKLMNGQQSIIDNSQQALKDHQKIMNSIQTCLPTRPNGG